MGPIAHIPKVSSSSKVLLTGPPVIEAYIDETAKAGR